MNKARVEAFTDAIVAIVMTIMALEIKVPDGSSAASLWHEAPYFLAFIISFIVIASSWYHHHYFFSKAKWISKRAFWANTLWLLLMAFFPVATGWVSEHLNDRAPEYFYFFVYVAWAIAYYLLNYVLVKDNPDASFKMSASLSRVSHWVIDLSLLVVGIVLIWFLPISGMVIVILQSLTWAVMTPADSDHVA
ncbi:TMEM175 family protein [Lacticaseibacillus mingshuiensis]|uniref:TMEM175 family protein n=1 Tax=Lacticaseibacillus mingshuiensis TaxID=2799574 RepID=A0ABW4CES2_9LACO|nr:TMEM175 family protein [Lacticaseibacillus mingshuiensis]